MVKVLLKKLDASVELPSYKTEGASGMDLMAFIKEPINLKPYTSCLVPTGISLAFSGEFEIQIRPRSGLAAKNKVSVLNTPGTIDADYRGEIGVILMNQSRETVIIQSGDRIAQLVFAKVEKVNLENVTEVNMTQRGDGGFGSTGMK